MIEVIVCVAVGYVIGRTCHDHLISSVISPTVKAVKRICKNIAND